MAEPLLRIRNEHVPACGVPPLVSNDDPGRYVGYFANYFGEQWVFTYDRKTKRGELRGGDCGWNHTYEVEDGVVDGFMLNEGEAVWLQACWLAAAGTDVVASR